VKRETAAGDSLALSGKEVGKKTWTVRCNLQVRKAIYYSALRSSAWRTKSLYGGDVRLPQQQQQQQQHQR